MPMNDRLAALLGSVQEDSQRVSRFLAQLGESDGEYLHHVVQTLLDRHGHSPTASLALLVSRAVVDFVPESVLRFAAAIKIVEVAGLAHRQIPRGDALIPTEQPAIDLHIVVLAGDYLYSQSAVITAGLQNLTVMRLLAEVIKEQCTSEVSGQRHAVVQDHTVRLNKLAVVGTGHLVGCQESVLDDLATFVHALGVPGHTWTGGSSRYDGQRVGFGSSTLRARLSEIGAAFTAPLRPERSAPTPIGASQWSTPSSAHREVDGGELLAHRGSDDGVGADFVAPSAAEDESGP